MDSLEAVLRKHSVPADTETTTTQEPNIPQATDTRITDTSPIPKTETTPTPESNTSAENTFDLKDFNDKYGKRFGREISKEDELKDLFSLPTKIADYENKIKEHETNLGLSKKQLEELNQKFEETGKFVDVNKYIADPLRVVNQMLLKYPDKDPMMMVKVGQMDLAKVDNFDLLVVKAKLDNPDIFDSMSDAEVMDYMANEYNVDLDDKDSWDKNTKTKIALQAKQVRAELSEMQKVEPHVPLDVEKLRAELLEKGQQKTEQTKTVLRTVADKMLEDFVTGGLSIPDPDDNTKELFKYQPELDEAFKNNVGQYIDFLSTKGGVGEAEIKDLLETIHSRYIYNNLPNIIKARDKQVEAKEYDKWHNENHNDSPLSTKTAPVDNNSNKMQSAIERIKKAI